MLIERTYQQNLLQFLLNDYPVYRNARTHCLHLLRENEDKYIGNVIYLQKHGLLEKGISEQFSLGGGVQHSVAAFPKITQKGIDFILEDGGLSAILNVQTIKIHPETIKSLIESKLMSSNIPESEKQTLIEKIRSLPEEGAKLLLDKLLDKGLNLLSGSAQNLLDIL